MPQIAPMVLDALLGMAALRAQAGAHAAALELVLHILLDPAATHITHQRAEQLRNELVTQLADDQIAGIDARVRATNIRSEPQRPEPV